MNVFSISLLCLTILLSLAGCANRSDTLSVAEATPSDAEINLSQFDGLSDAKINQQWWALFNDPQLNALIDEALAYNNNLQLALTRVKASQISLGLVDAEDALILDLNGNYERMALSENSPLALLGAPTSGLSLWDVGAAASWELDIWGYQEKLQDAALQTLNSDTYAADVVRVSLAAEITSTYLELKNILALEALAQDQIDLLDNQLTYTRSQQRNGAAAQSAVSSVQAALLSSESQLPSLIQQERQLRNRLGYLTGRVPGELNITMTKTSLALPKQISVGIPSEAVHHRPDILAAEAKLRAAMANTDAAEANFYPRVSLDGSFGFTAFTLPDAAAWNSRTFSIGPAFHLPVFDGGKLQKSLELTEVHQQQAAITYRDTVLKAWHEVDDAMSAYQQSKRRLDTQSEALKSWDQVVDSAVNQYSQGAASKLDIVIANLARLKAKRQWQMDNTRFKLNLVALQRSVSRSWSDTASENNLLPGAGNE